MEQEDLFSGQEIKRRGTEVARRLLERKPDAAYLTHWSNFLAKSKKEVEKKSVSVIVFRLYNEWLAISTSFFCEVISPKQVHRIPHRSNAVLAGVVNYGGVLALCVNMHSFLSISHEKEGVPTKTHDHYPRMVSIKKESEQWIFGVDEVEGVFHLDSHHLQTPPATLAKSKASYLCGMICSNNKNIGYLDEELLFLGLRRVVL